MNIMDVQLLGRVGTLETAGCQVEWSISTMIPEASPVECSLMLVVPFCVLECSVLAFCTACQTQVSGLGGHCICGPPSCHVC